jgi:tetratricopeptide (TPR) repeat protein
MLHIRSCAQADVGTSAGWGHLNYGYVAGAVALVLSAGAALRLLRGGRERAGFALLVCAPIVAGVALAAVSRLAMQPGGAPASASNPHANVDMNGPPVGAAGGGPARASPLDEARHRAEQLRIARRFPEAREAFAELTRLAPTDADAWADLADASAAAANGDLEQGAPALAKALALKPNHLKALWLQASLELQRKQYPAAAALWEKLLGLVPPGSNDARIVAANLEEARALARGAR